MIDILLEMLGGKVSLQFHGWSQQFILAGEWVFHQLNDLGTLNTVQFVSISHIHQTVKDHFVDFVTLQHFFINFEVFLIRMLF